MRILGVDPGSITTGYGVIDHQGGRLALVDQGCIRSRRDDDLPTRLLAISTGLGAVIQSNRPAAVAVETPFAGMNARTLIQLAQARGVILLAAKSAGLEIFEYSPRSVKSAIVGYGAAEKQQVASMVRMLLPGCANLILAADAADALAVAICHAHSYRMAAKLTIAK